METTPSKNIEHQRYEWEKIPGKSLKFKGFLGDVNMNIDQNFSLSSLWFHLDGYFSIMEPLEYEDPFLIPPEEHSPEFQSRREIVYTEILQKISEKKLQDDFTQKTVQSVSISSSGVLKIILKNNEELTLNIGRMWNEALFSDNEKKVLQDTRQKEQELYQEVSKKAFYSGNLIIEYGLGTSIAGVAALSAGYVFVKAFTIKTAEWPRRIELSKPISVLENSMAEKVMDMAKKAWYEYNFETKKFFNPAKEAFGTSLRKIQNMTFAEYQKKPYANKDIKTEAEFNRAKNEMLKAIEPVSADLNSGKIHPREAMSILDKKLTMKWFGKAVLLVPVFLADFMTEFRKHQTPANAIAGLSEMALFTTGAAIGAKVGKWPIAKVAASLIGGTAMMLGGGYAAEKVLDTNRKKWEYFQKSNYSNGRSLTLHGLSGLLLTESLDGWNGIVRMATGDNQKEFDFGTRRTRVNIPWSDRFDFTIPEITFLAQKVNLGTNPAQWIPDAATRDISQWNDGVERYKKTAIKQIYELMWEYYRNESIFNNQKEIADAGGKKELFWKELADILRGWNMSHAFVPQIETIVSATQAELDHLSPEKIPNIHLDEIILMEIDKMKINATYIERRNEGLNMEGNGTLLKIQSLPVSPEIRDYIGTFPERMKNNRQLYENDNEKKMYESVIKNTQKMNIDGTEMKIGNFFAMILDEMMEQKIEREFLKNISGWNNWGNVAWAIDTSKSGINWKI